MRKRNKLIHGVGVNDADYPVYITAIVDGKKVQQYCPYYERWRSMLKRCYSKDCQEKQPTYKGCSVCPEWLYFMTFRAWMIQQDWEGKQLDKDILVQGNKVYSPDTCVFISTSLNLFLTDHAANRGDYPIGVHYFKRDSNFRSTITVSGKREQIGNFSTPELAHRGWQKAKRDLLLSELGKHGDARIDSALMTRVCQLNYEIANNLITIKL